MADTPTPRPRTGRSAHKDRATTSGFTWDSMDPEHATALTWDGRTWFVADAYSDGNHWHLTITSPTPVFATVEQLQAEVDRLTADLATAMSTCADYKQATEALINDLATATNRSALTADDWDTLRACAAETRDLAIDECWVLHPDLARRLIATLGAPDG